MIPKDRLVKGADVQDLRELLGASNLDMFYLVGTLVKNFRVTGPTNQEPIKQPALAILMRYLDAFPDENFIPKMPDFEEVYALVDQHYPGKLSIRRFGTLCGNSGWSGNAWSHGGTPAPTVQRLFKLLANAILAEGANGLLKFLDIVDIEARARGNAGGLEEVLQRGTWGLRGEGAKEE